MNIPTYYPVTALNLNMPFYVQYCKPTFNHVQEYLHIQRKIRKLEIAFLVTKINRRVLISN